MAVFSLQIFVGGPTLAQGYLNRPELDASRFVERPAEVPEAAGPRLYRTGDWGYLLSSGLLEICGRCDSMVKIRGYSIEIQVGLIVVLTDKMLQRICPVLYFYFDLKPHFTVVSVLVVFVF